MQKRGKMKQTKKITLCGVMIALALALSYTERLIPLQILVPLPGIKLGLAILLLWLHYICLGKKVLTPY